MYATIETERKRLELLQASALVGICYLDGNKLVQEFDDDPALREMIIEYQVQRVRELELSKQGVSMGPGSVADDTLLSIRFAVG